MTTGLAPAPIIAHHLTEADEKVAAVPHWVEGAESAFQAGDIIAATECLEAAMAGTVAVPQERSVRLVRLKVFAAKAMLRVLG